ncbi:hypothetical protein UlMin_005030 [Ulmus minor]
MCLRRLLFVKNNCMIVTSALIIWKALMCITGSESPVVIVVVLSGSMEPSFKRGNILFLHMSNDPICARGIIVFNVDGREIPSVHRVIKLNIWVNGILTRNAIGDNKSILVIDISYQVSNLMVTQKESLLRVDLVQQTFWISCVVLRLLFWVKTLTTRALNGKEETTS